MIRSTLIALLMAGTPAAAQPIPDGWRALTAGDGYDGAMLRPDDAQTRGDFDGDGRVETAPGLERGEVARTRR